ncbi:2-methylcitrate dehydratase [Acuticoccus sediminis]|uniref:2-methylcitrate dehydratase n=1 Tax=Acuticoccus sediminis TaxID=2184697 RepID=A0A8B2NX15_9HYPH|nr:MmgE/PrpD family protein [Acuticoccus sediminis]RAI01892.1 2-methylcitrate dehydratase [Acuticoccus sediminis]
MLLTEIGHYVAGERTATLSDKTMHHAKRAVIDWFAAMYPGTVINPGPMLREALAEELGHGRSVVFPAGELALTRTAAFLNGSAAHTAEFDDIHRDSAVHPGCATIAAALACAQATGCDGETFLRGVIAGFEVSTRIGLAMTREHYKFWHATATISTFGASAASSLILGLNGDQTAHALATAATMAAGLQQAFRSDAMSKPIHAGHAAEAGVTSAMAAAKGVTGALDVLDGPVGMGAAMSGKADWSKATAGLGRDYNIEIMTFKNHGCCGHTFAAIDGALVLKERHGLTPDQIARIEVGGYRPTVDICDRPDPRTPVDCKFSLQYVVSHALVHGSVRLAAFEAERMSDPAVRALLPLVDLRLDEEIDSRFPGQRAARVAITTRAGDRFEFLQPTRKGDPDMPLSDEELSDKFTELAGSVLDAADAKSLLAALWGLEKRKSLDLPGTTAPAARRASA